MVFCVSQSPYKSIYMDTFKCKIILLREVNYQSNVKIKVMQQLAISVGKKEKTAQKRLKFNILCENISIVNEFRSKLS